MMAWMNSHLRDEEHARSIRVIGYLMAREYYEQPGLTGWISRAMQSIPVDRNSHDVGPTRDAVRRLKRGDLIGIFPEGGINAGDSLRAANSGIAFLALKANVPIIPVYIHGVPKTESMITPFYTPCRVRVTQYSTAKRIDPSGPLRSPGSKRPRTLMGEPLGSCTNKSISLRRSH